MLSNYRFFKVYLLLSTFCIFSLLPTPEARDKARFNHSLYSINESSSWLSITTYAFLTAVTTTVVHCVLPPLLQRIIPPRSPLSPAQYHLAQRQQEIDFMELKQQERERDHELVNKLREIISQAPDDEFKGRLQEQYRILVSHMAEQVIKRYASEHSNHP